VETLSDLTALTVSDLAEVHGLGRAGAMYVAVPAAAGGITVDLGDSQTHTLWETTVHPGLGARGHRQLSLPTCGLTPAACTELAAVHNTHLHDLTSWNAVTLHGLVGEATWREVGYLLAHLELTWRDTAAAPTFAKPFQLALDYAKENGQAPGAHKGFTYRGERDYPNNGVSGSTR
jgi:hypothetical protein